MGVPISPANVQRASSQRLHRHRCHSCRVHGIGAQLLERRCLGGDCGLGATLCAWTVQGVANMQKGRSPRARRVGTALGRDRESRPTENSDVTTLVGLKRVERTSFVVPDPNGSIQYRGKTYSEVQEANIFTRKANYVMLTADIQDGDFPLGTEYNQLVLCTNVVHKPGKENSYTLTPNDITSQGNTVIADYRRSVIIDESSIVHLTLILEF